MAADALERCLHGGVRGVALAVEEEHVATQAHLPRARLDLREAHLAARELAQASGQPPGPLRARAPEDDRRLRRPFADPDRPARKPHEPRLVVGEVLYAGAQDLAAVQLRRQPRAQG